MKECWLCGRDRESNRYFALYVNGSEGLILCHECEMMLVNHIRALKGLSTRSILTRESRKKKCLSIDGNLQIVTMNDETLKGVSVKRDTLNKIVQVLKDRQYEDGRPTSDNEIVDILDILQAEIGER